MARYAYVNGAYVHERDAAVHIEDRSHQLSDGVYEGITVYKSKLIDLEPHLDRLWRSMSELDMRAPMGRKPMTFIFEELVRRNRITNGFLYCQVSRGSTPRDHAFPAKYMPGFTATVKAIKPEDQKSRQQNGVAAATHPDIRWGRCDIKSTSLLGNCMAKTHAKKAGAFEAILYDSDNMVTEGSSTNIWMIKGGVIKTRSTDDNILSGITRMMVKALAEDLQLKVKTEKFSINEMMSADEVLLTSSTGGPVPIVEIDGKAISHRKVGPVSAKLIEAYKNHLDAQV